MPPKRGQKRKASAANTNHDAGLTAEPLSLPQRETWPGWVEIESEPAFFNVMLREMGVSGVRMQEVYGLDDDMLAILPQPVHALIFLFRYHTADKVDSESGVNHDHIWFANQIPEFACATVALLNVVNNIPGLELGPELRQFKEITNAMDPVHRGNAIDSFDHVRRIHNSFARETDLLTADVFCKNKFEKAKKKEAAAKARVTKEAKKSLQEPLKDTYTCSTETPTRSSKRQTLSTFKPYHDRKAPNEEIADSENLDASPRAISDDSDFKTPSKAQPVNDRQSVRRSARAPKPRRERQAATGTELDSDEEEGFHFIAYMPIGDRVWKLDGLDRSPHDLGAFQRATDDGCIADSAASVANWIHVAQPAIQGRMAQFEGAEIQFNLMAVVRDPVAKDREELTRNIAALQCIDAKLDSLDADWRAMEGAETRKDVLTCAAPELGVTALDLDAVRLSASFEADVTKDEDLIRLMAFRKEIISQQTGLRGSVRDALVGVKEDDEKVRHRRHDYLSFVRGWVGALAENEMLGNLMDE